MFVVVVSFNFHMKFHSHNFQGDEFCSCLITRNLSFLTILFYFEDGYKKKMFWSMWLMIFVVVTRDLEQ